MLQYSSPGAKGLLKEYIETWQKHLLKYIEKPNQGMHKLVI